MFLRNTTRNRERKCFSRCITNIQPLSSHKFNSSSAAAELSTSAAAASSYSSSSLVLPPTSSFQSSLVINNEPREEGKETSVDGNPKFIANGLPFSNYGCSHSSGENSDFDMCVHSGIDESQNVANENSGEISDEDEVGDGVEENSEDEDYQRIILEQWWDEREAVIDEGLPSINTVPKKRNHRNEFIKILLSSQMSRKLSFSLEDLLRDIYGKSLPFTLKSIWEEFEDAKNDAINSTVYTCNSCSHILSSKSSACDNWMCITHKKTKKKGKTTSCSSITRLNIGNQLREVIEHNFADLEKKRSLMHDGCAVYPPEYVALCESKEDFEQKRLIVPITLTCDGARFKADKSNEYTPFLIRIEGIDSSNLYDHVLAAFHKGANGVQPEEFDLFTEKLVEEILTINRCGILLNNGFVVKLAVLSYLSDVKAMKIAGGIPNWMIKHGCNICYIEGSKIRNFMSFNQLDHLVLRTTEGCFTDATMKVYGFRNDGVPIIFILCTPNKFKIDTFHILSEGIEKKSLNEMSESSWNWSKKRRGRFDAVEDSLNRCLSYTYGTSILPFKSRSTATGVQISMMSRIAFPLTALGNVLVRKSYGFYLLSFWTLIVHHNCTDNFVHLKDIMYLCGKIHIICEPDYVSIKHHFAYCHLIEQWMNIGSDYDVKDFEKLHCLLQRSIHFRSTNNVEDMISRYLIARKMSYSDTKAGPRMTSLLNALKHDQVNIIDKNSMMEFGFDAKAVSYWSRVLVFNDRTKKSLIFGSNYWEKTTKTCQNIIASTRNGRVVFHEIRVFFEFRGVLLALTNEFLTEKGEHLTKKLLQNLDTEDRIVAHYCERLQEKFELITIPFDKILSKKSSFVAASDIVFAATIIPFEREEFITIVT